MLQKKQFETLIGVSVLIFMFSIISFWLMHGHKRDYRTSFGSDYLVTAHFREIGELKTKAPVKLGGVCIGRIKSISLNPDTLNTKVEIVIQGQYNRIPQEVTAVINTAGPLGETYIRLKLPVWYDELDESNVLKMDDEINSVRDAIILEDYIEDIKKFAMPLIQQLLQDHLGPKK